MTDPAIPRSVARMWSQTLPYEVAAKELKAAPAIVREAADADGRITYGDAVAAVFAFYRGKIADDAFEAALRPARRGLPPGKYGVPLHARRLRTDAARAAQGLVDIIDRRLARLAVMAANREPEPGEARALRACAGYLDHQATALAKRNAGAVRGLGPKEVKA